MRKKSGLAAYNLLGRDRFVAMAKISHVLAVEDIDEDLAKGLDPRTYFILTPEEKWRRDNDLESFGGFFLYVKQISEFTFDIEFGYSAGGLAGDGFESTITYNQDGTIAHYTSPKLSIF